ncbi:MAG: alanine--tRNA ligase [Thermodesulfobacteriota bacterium]
MKSSNIREAFIKYFTGKGHSEVASSALIPTQDPTLLFTNAGMVQFKGVFLGEEKRDYKRAVSSQKCMRAGGKHNDLENVGKTARHHTFFEMLGNFSFGDYFKDKATEFAWDFLTVVMELPVDKLWVTIYKDDDEAGSIWIKNRGVSPDRVVRLGEKDNFWSMGSTGPCGPCSEILIDQGEALGCGGPDCRVGCECDRYLEIWNLVFMEYNRQADGTLLPLAKPSIDTGMGLERLSAVMQGVTSNYETDLFVPILNTIKGLIPEAGKKAPGADVSLKAIADHSRAITFLMAEGVLPGNTGRNYVLRRIIRRALRHGRFLGLTGPFLGPVISTVIEVMGPVYPEIKEAENLIQRAAKAEEESFLQTLERGLEILDSEVSELKKNNKSIIPGPFAFKLYDTYGFPVDLTADIVTKDGLTVDEAGFNASMDEQRKKARLAWKGGEGSDDTDRYRALAAAGLKTTFTGYSAGSSSSRVLHILKEQTSLNSAVAGEKVDIITEETPFYGESGGQVGDQGVIRAEGLEITVKNTTKPVPDVIVHHCVIKKGEVKIDDSVELFPDAERRAAIRRNHTATHIVHAALRELIGGHVRQRGSLVSADGFRFDFSHFSALTYDELKAIEKKANEAVLKNIKVTTDVLPYDEAIKAGALAFFDDKYGASVRLVSLPGVSKELCGGTHVNRSGDIGLIKLTAESSVASGIRRLEAVTGTGALKTVLDEECVLREAAAALKVSKAQVGQKIKNILNRQRSLEKEIETLKKKAAAGGGGNGREEVRDINGVKVIALKADETDPKILRDMADTLRSKVGSGIVIIGAAGDKKAVLLAAVTRDLTEKYNAGEIIKNLAPVIGGRGGGRAELAQAGGADGEKIDEALARAYEMIEDLTT